MSITYWHLFPVLGNYYVKMGNNVFYEEPEILNFFDVIFPISICIHILIFGIHGNSE